MDFLKGVHINLRAAGPAGVFGIWFIAVAAVGLFGAGPIAERALALLGVAGIALLFSGYLNQRE